jgi:nickel-dependent lactate racemase
LIVGLRHGHGSLTASLPDGIAVERWAAPVGSAGVEERDVVARAVDRPIDAPPLTRCAAGARRVSILVSGKDRVAGAQVYLPVILDRLSAAGVSDQQIEIVCATGTHARHSPEDVKALVGAEVAGRVRFRAHDCDGAGFVDLGRTSFGTPVRFDRGVVEADLRVLTGRVVHHYFAGFSGGRKSLLPGVAARATIVANHRLVLDLAGGCRVHPGVFGGNLVGNPVHEDMVEAARKVGPSFVVNTLLDGANQISHVFAGELEAAHQAACREAVRTATFTRGAPADLVLASPGGHPHDINLIQSLKTLFNHRDTVRSGGAFVLVAEAAGGILAGMKDWLAIADRETLGRVVATRYDLAAHNSLMLRELLEEVRVVLVSRLPPAEVRALGLLPADGLDDALGIAGRLLGARLRTVRLIHHGNVTYSSRRKGVVERPRPQPADRSAPIAVNGVSGAR